VAYDEELAARVRACLEGLDSVTERAMFGGMAFMLHGNMCCGVIKEDLVRRLGSEGAEQALREPHTRPMDFTGRPLKGFVFVEPDAVRDDAELSAWVERAATFWTSLPAK